MTFSDRAGNFTTTTVNYEPVIKTIIPENYDFGEMKVGEYKMKKFILRNDSKTRKFLINELTLKSLYETLEKTGFSLDYEFDFGIPMYPGDTREFEVSFTATKTGTFTDSIGVGDSCWYSNKAILSANVISENTIIRVNDVDFGIIKAGSNNSKEVIISNDGSEEIQITGYSFLRSDFTTDLPEVSSKSPVIIPRGGTYRFNIYFKPYKIGIYTDTLKIISNAGSNSDQNCNIIARVSGVDKYVLLLKPQKALRLIPFDDLEIEWKTSEIHPVDLKLYDSGSYVMDIALYRLQLSYTWRVPKELQPSKNYRIRASFSYFPDVYSETPLMEINSVNEIFDDKNINVIANKANSEILIDSKEYILEEIILFDILGNKIAQYPGIMNSKITIPINALPVGKYFLRITTDKGVRLKQVVINR